MHFGNYFGTKFNPTCTSFAITPRTKTRDHIAHTTILYQFWTVGMRCCIAVVFVFMFLFFIISDIILLLTA